jgi:ketosteroid isomerase-like protein
MLKSGAILNDIYDAYRVQNLEWLASYLPNDFCHVVHVPKSVHPLAGACQGKQAVLERWRICVAPYDFLAFDINTLLVEEDRAAVEIAFRYRHKATGVELVTTKANVWVLEEGWPVRLTEYYDVAKLQSFIKEIGGRIEA